MRTEAETIVAIQNQTITAKEIRHILTKAHEIGGEDAILWATFLHYAGPPGVKRKIPASVTEKILSITDRIYGLLDLYNDARMVASIELKDAESDMIHPSLIAAAAKCPLVLNDSKQLRFDADQFFKIAAEERVQIEARAE